MTINYNGEEIKDFEINSGLGLAKTMYQNCQDGKLLVFTVLHILLLGLERQ